MYRGSCHQGWGGSVRKHRCAAAGRDSKREREARAGRWWAGMGGAPSPPCRSEAERAALLSFFDESVNHNDNHCGLHSTLIRKPLKTLIMYTLHGA
eukprot:SAG22_NODE_1374_length_4563_cov_1.852823_4_plen_96_part_00